MDCNVYVMPLVGDGLSLATAYWPAAHAYITPANGEWFSHFYDPGRKQTLCVVVASTANHSTIALLPEVIRLLPAGLSLSQVMNGLDDKISTLPPALVSSVKTALDAAGIETSGITGNHTVRQLIQRILRRNFLAQVNCKNANVLAFLNRNIDNTVASVPSAARNAISSWMTSRGLSVAWITGATTVGEVLRYIDDNVDKPTIKLARLGAI